MNNSGVTYNDYEFAQIVIHKFACSVSCMFISLCATCVELPSYMTIIW